jgi:hypothetical protein
MGHIFIYSRDLQVVFILHMEAFSKNIGLAKIFQRDLLRYNDGRIVG